MDKYKSLLKSLIAAVILLGIIYIAYETHLNRKMMADLVNTNEMTMQKVDQTIHILSIDSTGGSATTTVLVSDMANGGTGVPAPNMTVTVSRPNLAGLLTEVERGVTNSEGFYRISARNTICCDESTTIKVLKVDQVVGSNTFRSSTTLLTAKVYINQPPVTR